MLTLAIARINIWNFVKWNLNTMPYSLFFFNIKPMKGIFCTNNYKKKQQKNLYNPDRKWFTFDEYILYDVQSSYNCMRFYT